MEYYVVPVFKQKLNYLHLLVTLGTKTVNSFYRDCHSKTEIDFGIPGMENSLVSKLTSWILICNNTINLCAIYLCNINK